MDIRFPDVSQHGQGLHLMSYDDPRRPWKKLTLWHAIKPCKLLLLLYMPRKLIRALLKNAFDTFGELSPFEFNGSFEWCSACFLTQVFASYQVVNILCREMSFLV